MLFDLNFLQVYFYSMIYVKIQIGQNNFLLLAIVTCKTTLSSSESFFMSKVSIRLLVSTIAARILASPNENILYFLLYMVLECRACLCCPPQLSSID